MPDTPGFDPRPDIRTFRIPVAELRPADSPRLIGQDMERIRILAESDRPTPPIVVQRRTMRVIDGMHRLGAALLRGQDHIEAVFFDGDDDDAFVLAVQANVEHGLPLSFADREAAVQRIMRSHAHWSDRAIAQIIGLSARTVAAIRSRTDGLPPVTGRVGRDGRVRPLDSSDGRRAAGKLLLAHPTASLREIARTAGISPATVRDVRDRMHRGEDPVPERPAGKRSGADTPLADPMFHHIDRLSEEERHAILKSLERDPALRLAESGRMLLRWFHRRVITEEEWQDMVSDVPPHSGYIIARLARQCSKEWLEFAQQIEAQRES